MYKMKDRALGNRLKFLRNNMRLTQKEAAFKIGFKLRALQSHESGQWPNRNNMQKYIDFYQCDRVWLLTGDGEQFENDEFIKKPVGEPVVKYKIAAAPDDPFARSVSGLREIFNSQDQVLISAIQANIQAFRLAVQREHQTQHQSIELHKLKEEYEALKERVLALEDREKTPCPGAAADRTENKAT